jgi:integrase
MGNMGNKLHFVVSPYPSRPATPWRVNVRESFAGQRIRRFCSTEAEAWAVGAELVRKIRAGGVDSATSNEDGGLTVARAGGMFLERVQGKSKSHREKAEKFVHRLGESFGLMSGVTAAGLERWVRNMGESPTSQATAFRYSRMFFRWAHSRDMIERDPMRGVDCPQGRPRRKILSVDEMDAFLSVPMPGWLLASIVLGGFAGLRTEEMLRMRWEDVRVDAGEIDVLPGVMKDSGGFCERIVNFTEPIQRRAGLFSGKKGMLVPKYRRLFHDARRGLARSLGWPGWPENSLRHSFATYHLAKCGNPALTAYQMGHTSSAMVQRVYAVPARRADAAAWWGL